MGIIKCQLKEEEPQEILVMCEQTGYCDKVNTVLRCKT